MRALILIFAASIALVGCSNAVEDAEKELAIIQKSHGTRAEICQAKRKVADAHLKAHDQPKYEAAKVDADIECQAASLDASVGT